VAWAVDDQELPADEGPMRIVVASDRKDMCGEDVSFCLDAKEQGFEIWCDPRIRVGHEKTRII
jgi:hypothetical protein